MKKYQLIIVLSLIAGAMAAAKWSYNPAEDELIQKPTEAVTPTGAASAEAIEAAARDYPMWDLLPYQGEGFVIEKYTEIKTLGVRTEVEKRVETEAAVKAWLEDKGFGGDSHRIEWLE